MPSSLFFPTESISGSLKTIDPVHEIIHKGQHYVADHYLSVGTATAVSILLTVPTAASKRYMHFSAQVICGTSGVLTFSKDPNASGGTTLVSINSNGQQRVNKPDPMVLAHTVTYVSSGTTIETLICASAASMYTPLAGGREYILEVDHTYLLRFVSDTAANRVNIKTAYYYRDE